MKVFSDIFVFDNNTTIPPYFRHAELNGGGPAWPRPLKMLQMTIWSQKHPFLTVFRASLRHGTHFFGSGDPQNIKYVRPVTKEVFSSYL